MSLPVLGISGYSGAGKTTLIEALLPRLTERGLSVGVVKHDAHGLDLDRAGKDSDRFFRAGGDVLVRGPHESALRLHAGATADLNAVLAAMIRHYDLILVEGHKTVPLPARATVSPPRWGSSTPGCRGRGCRRRSTPAC